MITCASLKDLQRVTSRTCLDDPSLSLTGIFQKLCFQFNNEDYIVQLPDNADDVEGSDTFNPSDFARIHIHRECKYQCL